MMQLLTKARSIVRRNRAGDSVTDQVAADLAARQAGNAWGELPVVKLGDPHGPIVNIPMTQLDPLDYTRAHLLHIARTHELVNACLRIRADRLIKPRVTVERAAGPDEWQRIEQHPLLDLIRVPDEHLDTAAFWRFVSMSWDAVGYVYLEPIKIGDFLIGVNPLDPQYVKEFYTSSGKLDYYQWYPGYGERVIFQPDQLIVRRRLNDIDPAPLISALSAVESDLAYTEHIRSFFANSGIPPGIVIIKGSVSPEDSDAIKEKWLLERGRGGKYQNAPVVMGSDDASYQEIGSKLQSLDNEILRELIESRICMPFGVPPITIYSFFGLRHGTYSNVDEAWNSYWETTVETLLSEWADWMTRALLPFYENPNDVRAGLVRVAFDVSGIPAMQEDRTASVAMEKDAFDQGIISINERRQGMGMDRLKEPAADEIEALAEPAPIPPQLAAFAAPTSPNPAEPVEPDEPEEAKRRPGTPWVVHNVKAKPKPTPRLDADVAKYLKDEYAKARRLVISEGPAGAQVKLEDALDDGTALFGTLGPAERRAYADSWRQAALKIDWDVTLDTGDVSSAVDLLAERCVGIAGTTRQEIADLIIRGTQEQWSDAEIAEKIGELGFTRSAARAPLITRTELAIASTTAARDAYQASGVVSELEWLTGPDPCPECQERDGKHYALDSAPELPAHPSCVCDYAPIVSSVLEVPASVPAEVAA